MNVIRDLAQTYRVDVMHNMRDDAEHYYELAMEYARQLPTTDERLEGYKKAMVFNDLALALAKIIVMQKV